MFSSSQRLTTQEVYYEVEVRTWNRDESGAPILKKEKRLRVEVVESALYRPETDDAPLSRIAAKAAPDGRD